MYATVYPPPPAPQPELGHLTTLSCYFPESLHRGPFKGAQRALFGVINKTLVLDKKRMDALWNIFTACLGMRSVHSPSQNSTPLLQQATEPRASWDSWSWRGWSVGGGWRDTLLPPSFSLEDLQLCRFKGTVKKVEVLHHLSFLISENRICEVR